MHNKMEQFKDMDAQLIDEVGKGNQAAFDILFSKYNNKVYASLRAFTKAQELAEDLTQKTFIRVWKKIETFRGDSSLFTWIYSCLLYTSPSPRDQRGSRMPSSA